MKRPTIAELLELLTKMGNGQLGASEWTRIKKLREHFVKPKENADTEIQERNSDR